MSLKRAKPIFAVWAAWQQRMFYVISFGISPICVILVTGLFGYQPSAWVWRLPESGCL
jgi:hypothetical protein